MDMFMLILMATIIILTTIPIMDIITTTKKFNFRESNVTTWKPIICSMFIGKQ